MVRVVVDQDITPIEHLVARADDTWETTVGIETDPRGLQEALADQDVALVTSRVPLTREVLARASHLQVVGKLGTGIDSVDLGAAQENGITVTHTPGHNALSVAEHTLALVLATTRRFTAARGLVADGRWRDEYELGMRLSGSTVGLIGFGNVGKRFGTLLSGFDVDVLVHDPYVPTIDTELVAGEPASLDALLSKSDVVVVVAELTDETRGMIGSRELSRMDSDAILVNTARGPIVQEDALLDALTSGSIAGAGLDVFSTEPLGADTELLELENVVLTPHIAAMTAECRNENIAQLVENVSGILAGDHVPERYIATDGT